MKLSISLKRWSVWRLIIALLVVGAALITGCAPDTASSGVGTGGTGYLTAVTVPGVKSVYLSKLDTSTATPAGMLSNKSSSIPLGVIQTLGYLSATGKNEPVVFETSAGKHVVLDVTTLKAIKDGFITIAFDAMIESQEVAVGGNGKSYTYTSRTNQAGQALVDMSSGKVYNLSGYDIDNLLVDKNCIYLTKTDLKYPRRDLYKISFNDLSQAIPLNNGNYTPAGALRFISNNRIVGDDHSFDINGVAVPKPLTWVNLTSAQSTMTDPGEPFSDGIYPADTYGFPPYVVDNAGNIWGYRCDSNGKFGKFQVSLDNDGNTVISNYEEFTLNVPASNWTLSFAINGSGNNADRVLVGDKGYYYVTRTAGSGISFEAGPLTFTTDFPYGSSYCATYYNGALYWVQNSTIYSMNLRQNQTSLVYQSSTLVNPVTYIDNNTNQYDITLTQSNGNLIFYQYTNPTTIGTYGLTIGNSTPVLLSQSAADILQIVELSF